MIRLISIILAVVSVVTLFVVPVSAAESQAEFDYPVKHGLFDDHFVYEGVTYSDEQYTTTSGEPAFIYVSGNELYVAFTSNQLSTGYVSYDAEEKMYYFDSSAFYYLRYDIAGNGRLNLSAVVRAYRLSSSVSDPTVFRDCFVVSNYDIYWDPSISPTVFRSAEPVIYVEYSPPVLGVISEDDFYALFLILLFCIFVVLCIFTFVR